MSMTKAIVVSTARTPIGRAKKGALQSMRPDDLAAHAVKTALARVPALPTAEVEDVLVGCAQPAGEAGYNLARVVTILAGLPAASGVTINRYCASSLQALRMAAHAIEAGEGDVFVAAGVEAVSRFPQGKSDGLPGTHNPKFAEAEARTAERAKGGGPAWTKADGAPDIYVAMGQTAENVAELEGVSRREMDELSVLSHERAIAARDHHARDIAPITLADGTVVERDEGPRSGTSLEKLATLEPVFRPNGLVTAGNACPLNDGAAAAVVMSERRAKELGLAPRARIVATAVSAIDPEIMGLGPVEASQRALARARMTIGDIDLVEINEAFAAQVIPSARALGVPWEKLNVHGGAIALGHPFGMTGVRMVATVLGALEARDKTTALVTLCVGGGQGMAMILERL